LDAVIISSVIIHTNALVLCSLLQLPVHGDHYLDVALFAQARLQRILKVENREPTEIEAALLKKYELYL
jgi:hypothetical protein